ncbi:C39 family peptidase [Bacillus sp. CGMCC 1.16607]|uniref:C39 family peptidase n=1 Tax=Bacillus sp. CGMCC 1.16607 TaxID=3351842 RepID=UPI00362F2AE4
MPILSTITIPLVIILAFVLLKYMSKSKSILFVAGVLLTAFWIDYTGKTAKIMDQLKEWAKDPVKVTSHYLEEDTSPSIIKMKENVLLDCPVIEQFPELPRGCEVTSLAMLLQSANVLVDKLTLAKEIYKNPTPYKIENGITYFGHPNDGFIGNMYTYNEPGLGVYHDPIRKLAEKYLPGRIKDFTGGNFHEIKIHLSDNRPVWVIINTQYKKLSNDQFQTWQTPKGKIQITYREHSVLITGYDQDFIYFNDPLTGEKNKKAPIKDFEESWVQMGRQAITYLP